MVTRPERQVGKRRECGVWFRWGGASFTCSHTYKLLRGLRRVGKNCDLLIAQHSGTFRSLGAGWNGPVKQEQVCSANYLFIDKISTHQWSTFARVDALIMLWNSWVNKKIQSFSLCQLSLYTPSLIFCELKNVLKTNISTRLFSLFIIVAT